MFSKPLCIVNKSSYEKEQLKLHQSFLGVKGGGGQKQPFEQPSLQHLAVTLKINICNPNFSQKYDKLNKYSSKMYKNIVHFFSKTLGGGAKIIM